MNAPADLIDLAREDLHATLRLAAQSGLGALEACYGSLARSAERLETAMTEWATQKGSKGPEARRALERFRTELQGYAAFQRNAGMFCAEWSRALRGPGGQAYSPPGGAGLPPLVSGGRRISVEA